MTEHDRPGAPAAQRPAAPVRRFKPRLPKLGAPPRLRLRLPPTRPRVVYAAVALLGLVLLVIFTSGAPEEGPELAVEVIEPAETSVATPVPTHLPPPSVPRRRIGVP